MIIAIPFLHSKKLRPREENWIVTLRTQTQNYVALNPISLFHSSSEAQQFSSHVPISFPAVVCVSLLHAVQPTGSRHNEEASADASHLLQPATSPMAALACVVCTRKPPEERGALAWTWKTYPKPPAHCR